MQSVTLNSKLTAVATTIAAAHALPFQLVRAHIIVESRGDTFAWREEPKYHYLWDNLYQRAFRPLTPAEIALAAAPADFNVPAQLSCSKSTEWTGQRASWGPMQVMGAEARSKGFTGNMPQLCDSDGSAGVLYGCLRLKQLANTYSAAHGWRGVSAAYNAGSPTYLADNKTFFNEQYVDDIAAAGGFEGLA